MSNKKTGSEFSRHWLLVLVCAVGIGVGVSSLPFYTQGLFIEAWIADFGWTRAQASLGILGSTLALAAVLPFIGSIVCVFYTSDAADDRLRVDLGGRRNLKKNNSLNLLSGYYDPVDMSHKHI